MKKLLISFSGGETSAFMTHHLLTQRENDFTEIVVVFANTGKEREETLEFINKFSCHFGFNIVWIEAVTNPTHGKGVSAKVVSFETASRNGEPYEAMIAKHGIPSKHSPHCTRELKKYAIRAFARSIGWRPSEYLTAIGIRMDEADRISEKAKEQGLYYPLIKLGITKPKINSFWQSQPFRLNLRGYEGNCNKCFKKSLRKLMTIEADEIEAGATDQWWGDMEKKYGEFIPESKKRGKITLPLRFYRGNMSINDIRIKAQSEVFKRADDDAVVFDEQLDISNGCSESCEVF